MEKARTAGLKCSVNGKPLIASNLFLNRARNSNCERRKKREGFWLHTVACKVKSSKLIESDTHSCASAILNSFYVSSGLWLTVAPLDWWKLRLNSEQTLEVIYPYTRDIQWARSWYTFVAMCYWNCRVATERGGSEIENHFKTKDEKSFVAFQGQCGKVRSPES